MNQKLLDDKWLELQANYDEDDPEATDDLWFQYLESNGLVESIRFEHHWGDGGVLDAIESLVKLIDSGQKLRVFGDPRDDGRTMLIFPRREDG